MGTIRRAELHASADLFGINAEDIHIIDHPQLQDGMSEVWPISIASDIIVNHLERIDPELVVTFDDYGVSGHPNHIATGRSVSQAVALYASSSSSSNLKCIKLESTNLLRKFTGPIDVLFSLLLSDLVVINSNPCVAYKAMRAHRSQFLWYRYIFIVLSRYTYVNTYSVAIVS